MNEKPLVSIIIPYYNNDNELFLRACFNSVAAQTYPNTELIVIDDGSAEKASALLRDLQQEYHFILQKQKNKGTSGALNTGIKYAKGKYLAFMGADDYWSADKIELQVKYMESAGTDTGACCSRGYYIFENDPSRQIPRLTRILTQAEINFTGLLKINSVMAISVMIRTDILLGTGLFDENTVIEDWDMWLRITDRYQMGYLPEPLVYYRRHLNNRSNRFDQSWYDSVSYILYKWKDKKGYRQSLNQLQVSAINNFARYKKKDALKIAFTNPQCAHKWLYWRGIFKIFVPGFMYSKK